MSQLPVQKKCVCFMDQKTLVIQHKYCCVYNETLIILISLVEESWSKHGAKRNHLYFHPCLSYPLSAI